MLNLFLTRCRISENLSILALVFVSCLCLRPAEAAQQDAESCCHDAMPLELNTTSKALGGRVELHRLNLPSAGLVVFELIEDSSWSFIPGAEAEQLDLVHGNAAIIEHSATHLVLAVNEPETMILQTYSPGPYRLITYFERAHVVKETVFSAPGRAPLVRTRFHSLSANQFREGEEVGPDADKNPTSPSRLMADLIHVSTPLAKSEPEEVDPDPDTSVVTIGGLHPISTARRPQILHYEPTCGSSALHLALQTGDDHSDTIHCSTPIAIDSTAAGILGASSPGGDHHPDHDVFSISITRMTTLEIVTTGATDTLVSLHDRDGQVLARDDDGAGGNNSRIVRTLAPGRYTVRITGVGGAEGPYRLGVAIRRPSF